MRERKKCRSLRILDSQEKKGGVAGVASHEEGCFSRLCNEGKKTLGEQKSNTKTGGGLDVISLGERLWLKSTLTTEQES